VKQQDLHITRLSALFNRWAGAPPEEILPIPLSGSNRYYCRLTNGEKTAIGTYGSDLRENFAFINIAKHLKNKGARVPEIYATDDAGYYLQEDFGDVSLFNLLLELSSEKKFSLIDEALSQLAFMQIRGAENFDFSVCYPVAEFDRVSIFWDLNYFKYCYLKASGVEIDEVSLERDFDYFANHLLEADKSFFMYRDFQSRNIMCSGETLGFIDFQGSRRGPLQYDVASFLFQAKTNFSEELREQALNNYLNKLEKLLPNKRDEFLRYYYSFVLFRSLQVLGAYGFRGLVEGKSHFLQSIPYALQNVRWLLDSGKLANLKMPYLIEILKKISANTTEKIVCEKEEGLTILVSSFAYKNGYPKDKTENGGGYVFDCRGLNNPGRVPELRNFNGCDTCIADFLEKHSQAETFLQSAFSIVSLSVENYLSRNFTNLSISFGCTGGQHRSVYCAERMAKFLTEKYPSVKVKIVHRELTK